MHTSDDKKNSQDRKDEDHSSSENNLECRQEACQIIYEPEGLNATNIPVKFSYLIDPKTKHCLETTF